MGEWRTVRLKDVCVSVDYGLTASASTRPSGTRFLRITDIVGPILDWIDVPFVDATQLQKQKYKLESGDIVIARTGATTGVSRWIRDPPDSVFASYLVRLRVAADVDSRFVGYALKSELFLRYVTGVLGDKSAQPNASATTLAAALLSMPVERREQAAVSSLLGALDDKIDCNHRIAATSRQLAELAFSAAVEAAPMYKTVSSIASAVGRGVAPRYVDDPGGLLVLNQKCIRSGRVSLERARRTQADRVPVMKLLRDGDVLINSTGVGTLGRVARWKGTHLSTVDSHVTIVRLDSAVIEPICAAFAFLAAQSDIERLGEGSTGQTELSRAKVESLRLALPGPESSTVVGPVLEALENRADDALAESACLAQLRDTLLPKLMSGRLRIKDAEKIVEDST